MLAAISINHARHQQEHGNAMKSGLERHGIDTVMTAADHPIENADFHVTWSVKRPKIWDWHKRTGRPILVQERGYFPDRMMFSSLGWNGLNNRATFPSCPDDGQRFSRYWPELLKPWKEDGEYVLVCGQVQSDASMVGTNVDRWAQGVVNQLRAAEERAIVFRPHPIARRHNRVCLPAGASLSEAPALSDDLKRAKLCVTFNSNSGVEAVCSGVPTVTMDEGAMAWPVAVHSLAEAAMRPDREPWAHRLAWCQWTLAEISDGTAWEAVCKAV